MFSLPLPVKNFRGRIEMKTFSALTKRNVKLFFKDKGMFFSSLITPIILLVLYATFLAKVYRDAFVQSAGDFVVPEKIIDGIVAGQLVSSLLAVTCITVAFCSNLLMVQDKVSGARKDLLVSPVNPRTVPLSYFAAAFFSTIIVNLIALAVGFVYIAVQGWFLTFTDVLLLLVDVILLTLFGTALSSIVNVFLSTNGQASAVGTIVSAGYGFLCGAYMPIDSFPDYLKGILMFLPGTYGTALVRNHSLSGSLNEMASILPEAQREIVIKGMKDGIDCNIYFFGHNVDIWVMYLILALAVVVCVGAYVTIGRILAKKHK